MSASDDKILQSVAQSPLAMVLSNPRKADNPLELVNEEFCRLTGYAERDIIGRNCRFLAGPQTDEGSTELLRQAIRTRQPVLTEILNYRSNGTAFRNGVMITPVYGQEGELSWFLGSQVDLGEASADGLAGRRARAAAKISDLPQRQRQVLGGMARGLLNKQIAWELKISEKTVKMHRARLIDRLSVSTSAEAIRLAVEAGL